ncbi:MAG TPA: 16S rRNA (guanine(527)-N(7))-methyltransferase RsmG [Hyphomicrobiaceae bacterium]|nr:16S rRNA (guanine(527)-N(7))-methyltransferase RsmG [Hyphomicrobiaceae bacterium]
MSKGAAHAGPILGPEDFIRGFGVSRETIERLETYAALLTQWQKAVNLVAPKTLAEIWHRHFADSAQLVRHAVPKGRIVDLGSGAGFPGLVLAILWRTSLLEGVLSFTLIEADQRKAAFLREAARTTGVPVDIVSTRIEDHATQINVENADVVTARALAPLSRLLELATPLAAPDATFLFLKGRTAADEVGEAAKTWDFQSRLFVSATDPEGRVVALRDVRPKTRGKRP